MRNSYNLKFIVFLFFTSIIFFLSSCSSAIPLKSDVNGYLIDEKNDRLYIDCSISLRAASISKDVYARGPRDDRVELYEITGLNPAEWLSENIAEGIPFVFRENGAVPVEPTIEDFDSRIILTQTEVRTIQIGVIDDKDIISGYINELLTGEEATIPSHDTLDFNYTMRFESEKYQGLQYLIQYYVDISGNVYLYDRGTRKCVLSSSVVTKTE